MKNTFKSVSFYKPIDFMDSCKIIISSFLSISVNNMSHSSSITEQYNQLSLVYRTANSPLIIPRAKVFVNSATTPRCFPAQVEGNGAFLLSLEKLNVEHKHLTTHENAHANLGISEKHLHSHMRKHAVLSWYLGNIMLLDRKFEKRFLYGTKDQTRREIIESN